MARNGSRRSWDVTYSSVSSSRVRAVARSSARRRSVTSTSEASTIGPSGVRTGPRPISTGTSEPSLRRHVSSRPTPSVRAFGSSTNRIRSVTWVDRKRSGISISTPRPSSSARAYPNTRSAWAFTRRMSPASPTMIMAFGAASTTAWKRASARARSSICRRNAWLLRSSSAVRSSTRCSSSVRASARARVTASRSATSCCSRRFIASRRRGLGRRDIRGRVQSIDADAATAPNAASAFTTPDSR